MSEKLLEVSGLKVVYETDLERVNAINDISFSLDKGKTIGIVGETGAGKTTFALSIMGLLPERTGKIKSGSIKFDGIDIIRATEAEMREIRGNRISMIFQDPMTSLNPVINIGDQIAETIELHNPTWSRKEIDEKVDEVLSLVGIMPSRKIEYPHQFSGGMRQRVVIAIALSCEPELLIADEPTTALDVTIQAQVLKMISQLKEKLDTAMIMITHDLGVVAHTCDEVAVVYAGEVVEICSVEDMFNGDKHHPYTVGLFGSIPNMREKIDRLSPIPGLMPDPTNLPKGCNFSLRCKECMDICIEENPDLIDVGGDHRIRCFLFNDKENINMEVNE
ncbi:MAG TPA: ABC transporter ATP-binding protein [Tissierellaceae bacterium]|nr:ABC transporter ATP-binding protein [Tissierellaceae bacterium]